MVAMSILIGSCGNSNQDNSIDANTSNSKDTIARTTSAPVAESKELKLGSQVWMSRNLEVSTFRNGDIIPEVKTNEEWKKAGEDGKPAWCYYNNDPANGMVYGKLYNQHAIHDKRGLAPEGWHIPSNEEWKTLLDNYGSKGNKKLNCTADWQTNIKNNAADNFLACPGGYRYDDGFDNINQAADIWSSSINDAGKPCYYTMLFKISTVFPTYDGARNGYSVRCIKDGK